MALRLGYEFRRGSPVLVAEGVLDVHGADELRVELREMLDAGEGDVVLDGERVSAWDFTGFSVLIEAHLHARALGRALVLEGAGESVLELLRATEVLRAKPLVAAYCDKELEDAGHEGLPQEILQRLRHDLDQRAWRPGDVRTLPELRRAYGASTWTVKAVLSVLQGEGDIFRSSNWGWTASGPGAPAPPRWPVADLHLLTAERLRKWIKNGDVLPDGRLPSNRELATELPAQVDAVQVAKTVLLLDGVLRLPRGAEQRGLYVQDADHEPTARMVKRATALAAALTNEIRTGVWPPGRYRSEEKLMKAYGVPSAVVVGALAELRREGLVEAPRTGRGTTPKPTRNPT